MDRSQQKELTLPDLLQIFRRRISIIYKTAAVMFLLGILVCIFSTRKYQATGTIQVQKQGSDGLNPGNLLGTSQGSSDSLDSDVMAQTQVKILQSNELALRTISALKLEDNPNFIPKPNPVSSFINKLLSFSFTTSEDEKKANARPDSPQRQARELSAFEGNLTVTPIPATRLIEISYTNPDPTLAATVVNRLAQELIDYGFETGYEATESASKALGSQLGDLRARSEKLQAQVAAMQRQSGLYNTGATDAEGHQQAYSSVLEQFQRSSTTLSDATQTRLLKEAIDNAVRTGDAEMLSSLAGNGMSGASAGVTTSLSAIQTLRGQQALLQGQLDQLKVKFGPGYPKVAELQGNIDGLEHSIQQEISRVAQRAHNDFLVADRTYQDALEAYSRQKAEADALNNKSIEYMMTRQEADDSRALYEDLLRRLKEVGIVEGLKSNTITIVDHALIPASPKKPNVPLYLAASLAFGLFAGAFGVVVLELLDDKIWDPEAVENLGFLPFGMLPKGCVPGPDTELIHDPQSRCSDAIRNLRSDLMNPKFGVAPKVLVVTSATPGRIKDGISVNLAASLARVGKRVLLVETEMRGALLRSSMGLPGTGGLSDMLTGASANAIVNSPNNRELFVLPAGAPPASPSELIESDRMKELLQEWREAFDMVILDAPPVTLLHDARILSEMADLTILVTTYGVSTFKTVERAHMMLRTHANGSIGLVMVGVPEDSDAYKKHYGQ